jgi:hypothetical protein
MGIGALICAFFCAFFLKEPQNSFGLENAQAAGVGASGELG